MEGKVFIFNEGVGGGEKLIVVSTLIISYSSILSSYEIKIGKWQGPMTTSRHGDENSLYLGKETIYDLFYI